ARGVPGARERRLHGQLLRELPVVTVRIGERGDAHAPLAVDRAGQQLDAALLERRAGRVDVVDPDAQLEPRAGLGSGDRRGLDLLLGRRVEEQVHEQLVELHADGGLVLEDNVDAEDGLVKRLRRLQILDEQADRADMRQRLPYVRAHSVLLSGWVLFRPPPGGEIIGLQKQRGPAGAGPRQTRIVLELERLALVLAAAVVAAELVAV